MSCVFVMQAGSQATKSKAVYGLKCHILVRLVLQTFKGGFRAQTMPITRSKQLVGVKESPRDVIQASTKSWFSVGGSNSIYLYISVTLQEFNNCITLPHVLHLWPLVWSN